MLEIEIDLYSGRPNPRVTLAPATAVELSRRLAALPPSPAIGANEPGLGYRGLLVTGLPEAAELRIAAGQVTLRDPAGHASARTDPDRALEYWLIETISAAAPSKLPPELRDALIR
ncbi:hypothetical protein [Roseicella sp. DB1501]|uniref:hypothetical protein n=1 Tax=Roseicella sp. DB1501 TaxID=2730925 RepID=UPI001491BBC6|nr:hypothetical protein [Roseicella sp. DB1501]NOG70426.1 hypothetical protein [Roseicella sp. DB1501]